MFSKLSVVTISVVCGYLFLFYGLGVWLESLPPGYLPEFRLGQSGAVDIAAFWSAFKVLLSGASPYQDNLVFALQKELHGPSPDYLLAFLNPPWFLIFISPIAVHSFSVAVVLFLLLSVLCLTISWFLLAQVFQITTRGKLMLLLFCVLSGPAIGVFAYNQVGLITLLGFSLFLYFDRSNYQKLAGFSLILTTFKPNIGYLFFPCVLVWVIREKKWPLMFGALLALSLLLAPTIYFCPQVIAAWLGGYSAAEEVIISPTIGSMLRAWEPNNQTVTALDLFFIPLASIIAVLVWALRKGEINWSESLPTLLVLSLISIPHVNYHDHVLLYPAYAQIIASSDFTKPGQPKYLSTLSILLVVALVYFIGTVFVFSASHQYFWLPIIILGLLHCTTNGQILVFMRRKDRTSNT